MTDYAHLKALAEAATQANWQAEGHQVRATFDKARRGESRIASANVSYSIERANRDAAFIAAANPKAVLELIAEVERLQRSADGWEADCRIASQNNEDRKADLATLKAENEKLREALGRLGRFFTNAEQEAGYLVANEEETGIGDIKEALEAVVFNDDGQDFLFWVQYARKAMEKSND